MELLPPPRASAARSGVRQAALASIGAENQGDRFHSGGGLVFFWAKARLSQ